MPNPMYVCKKKGNLFNRVGRGVNQMILFPWYPRKSFWKKNHTLIIYIGQHYANHPIWYISILTSIIEIKDDCGHEILVGLYKKVYEWFFSHTNSLLRADRVREYYESWISSFFFPQLNWNCSVLCMC